MNRMLGWFAVIAVMGATSICYARQWHDASGKHAVEATYVGFHSETSEVRLLEPSGRRLRVKLENLSKADREFTENEIARERPLRQVALQPAEPDPGAMPAEPSEAGPAEDYADAQRRVYKRIYCGCHSDWHLIARTGTGAYWLHGQQHLVLLNYVTTIGNYIYYRPVFGHPGIRFWAFEIRPHGHCHEHAIWYFDGRWHLYDKAHVKFPL